MDTIPIITVLITCHNRKEKTSECIKALFNQNKINIDYILEVYIVDDGSSDGTSQLLHKLFPQINIIQGDGTLFWNKGMYLAWEKASKRNPEFYLWLNDDTILLPGALIELIELIKYRENNSIICGAIQSLNGEFTYGLSTKTGQPILPNEMFIEGVLMNGNCVLIPKIVFKLIGNLDYRFPHAIGDFDYGLRACKKKIKIITTKSFIGICEKNEKLPLWCYRSVPLKKRINSLYSPLGNAHPKYFFLYELKHFGLLNALIHFITIHIRLIFPALWKI